MCFQNRCAISRSYEFQAHQQRSQILFFPECSTVIRGAPSRSQGCHWHSQVLCYATQPVAWATGSVQFSVRGYEVPSEPSEPSGTAGFFRRKPGLLLMQLVSGAGTGTAQVIPLPLQSSPVWCTSIRQGNRLPSLGNLFAEGIHPGFSGVFF
jgi:hypothetical protein